MKWLECTILAENESVEDICLGLLDFGIEGVQIIDLRADAEYLESNPSDWDYAEPIVFDENSKAQVIFHLAEGDSLLQDILDADLWTLQVRLVEDDWLIAWQEHYKPFEVAPGIVVCPTWEHFEAKDGQIVFKIEPGSAFGTGLHESTRLCIEAMKKRISSTHVLDIGCGSGILGIIALLLGANSALGLDTDADALRVSKENARLNDVQASFIIKQGNILTDSGLFAEISHKKYGIICANIVADVIIRLLPIVKGLLDVGGVFIASGIVDIRENDVRTAMVSSGFKIVEELSENGWRAFVAEVEVADA